MAESPFPGMDPYLERHWRDIHHRFLTYACDDLQQHLPRNLRARLEERVYVEPGENSENGGRGIYPDVRVVEHADPGNGGVGLAVEVEVTEPIVLHVDSEPTTEGYIEIIDVGSGNLVVAAIELLSLSNKATGEGQSKYVEKQREYRAAGVSLVEIDLLRSGKRVAAVPPYVVPKRHRTPYQVCVVRGWRPSYYEFYPAPLSSPLPTIRVPLRETDLDVPLNLQSLIGRCYHNGRYDDINYGEDPDPPLEEPDAQWAEALLKEKGLR